MSTAWFLFVAFLGLAGPGEDDPLISEDDPTVFTGTAFMTKEDCDGTVVAKTALAAAQMMQVEFFCVEMPALELDGE